jgi:hypothetical protein
VCVRYRCAFDKIVRVSNRPAEQPRRSSAVVVVVVVVVVSDGAHVDPLPVSGSKGPAEQGRSHLPHCGCEVV